MLEVSSKGSAGENKDKREPTDKRTDRLCDPQKVAWVVQDRLGEIMFEQVIKVLDIQIMLSSRAEKEWRKELKAAIKLLKENDNENE